MTPRDSASEESNIFIARQPIFKRSGKVFGYELLFRSGLDNFFDTSVDGEAASSKVITNSFLLIGIKKITARKKASINFTGDMLTKGYATLFPRELTVAEVLEDVAVTSEVVAACEKLVAQGYTLALDDFIYTPEFLPLVEIAHIIKFDIQDLTMDQLHREVERVAPYNLKLLAEKVETMQEYDAVKEMGFSFYQGYFFSKPNIVQGRDIPGSKVQYLQILRVIQDENCDFNKITKFVSRDVSLAYKLIKYVNSAAMRRRVEVSSLSRAISLIGELTLRKWLSLMMLSYMADDKPEELLHLILIRAKFCEQVGEKIGKSEGFADACYTVGMFSMLDVLLNQPMDVILNELNLSPVIIDTLTGAKRTPYTFVLELAKAYEYGDWLKVTQLMSKSVEILHDLPAFYEAALDEVAGFFAAAAV